MMKPKRFKLQLSRVLTSIQFCRSRKLQNSVVNPIPATSRGQPSSCSPEEELDVSCQYLPAPPPSTPHQLPRFMLQQSDFSIDESLEFASKDETNLPLNAYLNIHCASFSGDSSYGDISPVILTPNKNGIKREGKTNLRRSYLSANSGSFREETEQIEENVEDETEALLFSSKSFSYDSSCEFSRSMESTTENSDNPINKKAINVKTIFKIKRQVSGKWNNNNNGPPKTAKTKNVSSPVEILSPGTAWSSMSESKIRESVPVVKKSQNPYDDFKRSMLEMILEKQMFEDKDLEELLHCFLSLNAKQYHGVIVEAFSEIWQLLFQDSPVKKPASVISRHFKA